LGQVLAGLCFLVVEVGLWDRLALCQQGLGEGVLECQVLEVVDAATAAATHACIS
jgi:hypothetical protein